MTESIISLIAEVSVTSYPFFYPLNVTFTFAINAVFIPMITAKLSHKPDSEQAAEQNGKEH